MTFVQPYVPAYRVPFFNEMAVQLHEQGFALTVVHAIPRGVQADREDARLGPWSVLVRQHRIGLPRHHVTYRRTTHLLSHSVVVIAELASTNLDTYVLAAMPGVRLMLWGHGKAYVTRSSKLDERLEMWLAHRADHVFVYTQGGADYLRARGFDPARLTVVRNSTDTMALRRRASELSKVEVETFRTAHDLGAGPVAAFVGAFDESKSLPLLFDAASLVYEAMPNFRLIVAGAGALLPLVTEASRRLPFVRMLARADEDDLARIGCVAGCMLIPGRVGLVAVDALALGLPVVTTTFEYHAPEAEYLTTETSLIAARSPADLAAAVLSLLGDAPKLRQMSLAASELGACFGVEAMAGAFVERILSNCSA